MPVAVIYSPKMAQRIADVIVKRVLSPDTVANDLAWAQGETLKKNPRLDRMVAKIVKKARNHLKGKVK